MVVAKERWEGRLTAQKAPIVKNAVAIIGTIQWTSTRAVQPNMKRQMGRQKQPTSAGSILISGLRLPSSVNRGSTYL